MNARQIRDAGRRRRRWALAGVVTALSLLVAGAGAGAAVEERTVGSFGDGLMWAITLMTTAGFLHGPPATGTGEVVAAVLMISGFLLLSLASAVLAAVFVHDEEKEVDREQLDRTEEILARLDEISGRLAALEAGRATSPTTDPPETPRP